MDCGRHFLHPNNTDYSFHIVGQEVKKGFHPDAIGSPCQEIGKPQERFNVPKGCSVITASRLL
jgi:hypothetical protein